MVLLDQPSLRDTDQPSHRPIGNTPRLPGAECNEDGLLDCIFCIGKALTSAQ
jgi:hypothetical protein